MASPTIHSTTAPAAGLSSTSAASTIVDDLVVVITIERTGAGVPTHTIEAGFTAIFSQPHDDGSTDGRLSIACKKATSAGAQSYQAYTSSVGTETWTGLMVLDKNTYDLSLAYRAAGVTLTTNGVPNPPAVGSTGAPLALNDYLFAAISFWRLGSSLTLTPTHSVYTLQTHVAGAATADVALATRALTGVSTSEDPGAYADNQAPTGSSSVTIAFGAPLTFGKARQSDYVDNFTSGSARAYPQNVQAGSLLVAKFGRATNSTPTVTDSQSNTWAIARSHYDAGNDYRFDVWFAIAGSTGACTVTVTAAGGAGERTLAEHQGPYDATPLDAVNSAIGTSSTPSSGNVTPSVDGALVLGYIGCGTGSTSFTVGTGFTAVNSQTGGTDADTLAEALVQVTAAAQDADCTLSSSQIWSAIVATFKPVASGQTIAVGQVTETDVAQIIAWAPKKRLVVQATEADIANGITAARRYAVVQVLETDLAQVVVLQRQYPVGQATETDLAQAVIWAPKHRLVAQTFETDLAQIVTVGSGQIIVAVGQALEVDAAGIVSWSPKARLVGQAAETDTAFVITVGGFGVVVSRRLLRNVGL